MKNGRMWKEELKDIEWIWKEEPSKEEEKKKDGEMEKMGHCRGMSCERDCRKNEGH